MQNKHDLKILIRTKLYQNDTTIRLGIYYVMSMITLTVNKFFTLLEKYMVCRSQLLILSQPTLKALMLQLLLQQLRNQLPHVPFLLRTYN